MRAAVIVPPLRDFYFTPHRFVSMGAGVVETTLNRNGVTACLFEFPAQKTRGVPIPIPPELSYLKPYIIQNETGRASYFSRYGFFAPPLENCVEQTGKFEPDICFLSLFAYCYGEDAAEFASCLKKRMPKCPIVLGGAGAGVAPEYFLSRRCFDFVLQGEAETNLNEFVTQTNKPSPDYKKVPGCYWKENGTICSTEPARLVPGENIEPAWGISPVHKNSAGISVCISRGCPKNCRFCTSGFSHGYGLRVPGHETIRKFIYGLPVKQKEPHTINWHINIEDDNLIADADSLFTAIEAFKKRFGNCTFSMENGIDYMYLTENTIDRLVSSGMRSFNISIASACHETLRGQKRALDLERYEKIVGHITGVHRLPVITYFICGLENDTPESIAGTLAYLYSIPTSIGISPFYAIPGMDIFYNNNTLTTRTSCGSSAFQWYHNGLTTKQIITAFRLSRIINLSKSSAKTDMETELVEKIFLTGRVHTLVKNRGKISIIPVETADEEIEEAFFGMINGYGEQLRSHV